MNSQVMFKVLLIGVAAVGLVAILIHYNSYATGHKPSNETFEVPQNPVKAPDFTLPTAPGGPVGAEEDVYDVPAPVAEAAQVSAAAAAGPGESLRPADLLPRLGNTAEEQKFAQLYSTGQGDMQGINFLDAGSQIGLSTRLNRNANLQLRSDPPIAKQPLPFMYSTIESDRLRQPLEIGSASTAVPVH